MRQRVFIIHFTVLFVIVVIVFSAFHSIRSRFFHPLHTSAAFSSPAFTTLVMWCRVFRSRIFSRPVGLRVCVFVHFVRIEIIGLNGNSQTEKRHNKKVGLQSYNLQKCEISSVLGYQKLVCVRVHGAKRLRSHGLENVLVFHCTVIRDFEATALA